MYKLIKRILDFIFALILLVISSPLFLIIALSIKLDSKGPVFYIQERLGKDKRIFRLYKFRSMVHQARKIQREKYTPPQKLITGVGRIIKSIHIDELPQVFNILKGQMSFVGPRPVISETEQAKLYSFEKDERRYKIRGGITGPERLINTWPEKKEALLKRLPNALYLREETERLPFDLYYIKHQSFTVDFWILWYTFMLFWKRIKDTILRRKPKE